MKKALKELEENFQEETLRKVFRDLENVEKVLKEYWKNVGETEKQFDEIFIKLFKRFEEFCDFLEGQMGKLSWIFEFNNR